MSQNGNPTEVNVKAVLFRNYANIRRRFRMKINTLRKFLCTLSVGAALLLGMSISTHAQGGPPPWAPAYGRRNIRPYGQLVSDRRHRRNASRRDLMLQERSNRQGLNYRLRQERAVSGNNPTWRYQRRQDRATLRSQQRAERGQFNQRWRERGRH